MPEVLQAGHLHARHRPISVEVYWHSTTRTHLRSTMIRQTKFLVAAMMLTTVGCTCSSPTPPSATAPETTHNQKSADSTQPVGRQVVAESARDGAAPPGEPNGKQPANGERPKLKSRWGRSLADQIDRVDGGTSEERDLIRETLRKNDDTLDRAFSNMPGRIEAANNTHDGRRRIAIPAP